MAPLIDSSGPEPGPVCLSVVIPARNEEANIAATVAQARRPGVLEIIVVDGASSDRTAELAERAGARVLLSQANRGLQQNLGAAAARGEVLLFLHADTRLPADFVREIGAIIASGRQAGAFTLKIAADGWGLRLVERVVDRRSRWLGLPYGDQAIFVTAEAFRDAGGFPGIPVMEDYVLLRKLKSRGRIGISAAAVETSARRWRRWGIWRATWINQLTILAFFVGVSPERISRWREGIAP